MKKSFGLVEVIVSVSILIFIGVTIITLNMAGLKLANESESKTVAFAQLEQATSYFKAQKAVSAIYTPTPTSGSFNCPIAVSQACTTSAESAPITINRREYTTQYSYADDVVTVTVSWKEAGKPKNKLTIKESL